MASAAAVDTEDVGADPLAAEQRAFERQRPRLLRRYRGQFVAIHGGKVVDHAADDEALAQRMFERLGDVPFYIARVESVPTVYELPSPDALP